ncbi:hypothetical protein FLONG3_8394 [Fusarium longipes]|uniref:Uncharacterized protein n=1 Tax=Fusarium longipes TaxID=694270 RepID=A0A395S6A2_9HYPO|nr:hypothetical protein FLONG3_8394 [Fusarium longipes]
MSNPSITNIFTCTFCFHISWGPPQIIGRSARLACIACHAALLKLAICWVCGELVFRDDEAIYQGVPIQELFRDDELEDSERGGCGGKEVSEVPLCAAYVVEVEVDGVKEESMIINRALRRVEKVDGGLTRKRWETNNNERNSESASARQPPIYRIGDGLTGNEGTGGNSYSNFRDTSKSVIWVDIFDPINGPSFQPSPLKPIPLFMQRPASPIHEPYRRVTAIDTHLQAPPYLRKPHSAPGSVCPPRSPVENTISDRQRQRQRQPSPSPSVLSASRSRVRPRESDNRPSSEPPKNNIRDNELSEVRHKQAISWVREEPLKRPSSRLAPSRHSDLNRSEATTSAYRTPPEYPDQPLVLTAHVTFATNCKCGTTVIRVSGSLPAHDGEICTESRGKKIEESGSEFERGGSFKDKI